MILEHIIFQPGLLRRAFVFRSRSASDECSHLTRPQILKIQFCAFRAMTHSQDDCADSLSACDCEEYEAAEEQRQRDTMGYFGWSTLISLVVRTRPAAHC